MPGPLASAHAKYEDDCTQCHGKSRNTSERAQCLACHKDVAADVRDKHGFHGLSPQVQGRECRQCHSEHRGRDADIVGFVPSLFDHAHSDFPLEGQHRTAACDGCHAKSKKFREAPSACVDCHRDDDVHKERMGQKCQDCHSAKSWRETGFDHSRTHFPLRDAHRKVECASCHPGQTYKDVPTQCVGCHRLQDRHGGLFGRQCGDCHAETDWKRGRFNHDKVAEFPLRGQHAQVSCHACHSEGTRDRKLATDCYGCHQGADFHQGRFGRKCADCHGPESWTKKAFNHDLDTAFRLEGPHGKVACDVCHVVPARKGTPTRACVDCHRRDDAHRGQLGDRCDSCHRIDDWRSGVRFDHDLTDFPLIGLHALVPCAECHVGGTYKSARGECRECHAARDVHKGALGERCGECHSPLGWARWTFDHGRETEFPLEGAHQPLRCEDCHRKPDGGAGGMAIDRTCISCHAADDTHRGAFGSDCARCHDTNRFADVQVRRPGMKPGSKETPSP